MRKIVVMADASVQEEGAGVGLAIKDAAGKLIGWRGKRLPRMTNTAAEYAAVVFALEQALGFDADDVTVCCDSQVVIEQLRGVYAIRCQALQPLHQKVLRLAQRFAHVCFVYIPRAQNRLADAMAAEVVNGD